MTATIACPAPVVKRPFESARCCIAAGNFTQNTGKQPTTHRKCHCIFRVRQTNA
ncbi:hypothetical protein LHK_02893 [Laribacter hongkongensis HLHK9]|uniref:Uncharacterized protein n=2 Tax=Laribacter hongkongensis TaxID=168471 RepID=C1D4T0_LARHH|nr:hypothetical protein LHK_02893 [Laribacter hongkongensis HLHK9]ASJ25897.1 hypothetical protein LHGZ1_3066 [Laribacter hongkongensis]